MKRFLLLLFTALSVVAEELPPAPLILASARAQLPPYPVFMSGTLKKKAPNGFVKKTLNVEMTLNWGAEPPQAEYKITDPDSGDFQTLEIRWNRDLTETKFSQNGEAAEYDPHAEIADSDVTWADLSFSFLWSPEAKTEGKEKKFGKERYEISIPRPSGKSLRLWVEKENGRFTRAEEYDATGSREKTIEIDSLHKFGELWMVKDINIIHTATEAMTSLRIDKVEARP